MRKEKTKIKLERKKERKKENVLKGKNENKIKKHDLPEFSRLGSNKKSSPGFDGTRPNRIWNVRSPVLLFSSPFQVVRLS